MERAVRKIEMTQSRVGEGQLTPISMYDNTANIVLLGDPGAGKTHTFRAWATRCGGRYVTARAFLVTPGATFDGALFIDGLDEKRAGRSDRDTVDALTTKLFEVRPPKVRISCRAADWLGDSDIAALHPYFELNGDPVVLQLDRLSVQEQRAVLEAEGLTTSDADSFLGQANERALGDLLENPQNLIMLLRAVKTGKWPETRTDLFQLSTQLMLEEFNKEHSRSGAGVYTANELRPAAGAVCAARLISDVEAIGVANHETSATIPSYRSLSMLPPDEAIAALSRRVFESGAAPETVDYAHRTTAEYLGAAWLAETVRNGLPLKRVQALMGVDGHPAPELRGLHAWLAVHLSEQADGLIDTDPYGVLTYGDAASLPRSACAHLVRALGRLSQADPWFRSGNWQSPAIGALARADMVDEFRTVLRSSNAGFGVRSIVVEAAALGAPMPPLKDDFVEVLLRTESPFAERHYALAALIRIAPDGTNAAEAAFHRLGANLNDLRLRAEIIHQMYGRPFGPAEVITLLSDLGACADETITGVLYTPSERLPLNDIPAVLDGVPPRPASQAMRGNEREVARFIERVLIRAWREIADLDPARGLQWLRLRSSYSDGYGRGRSDELRAVIGERKDRLSAIADHFLETLTPDENRWVNLARFREATLFLIPPEDFLDRMVAHLTRVPTGSEKELFLYQAALGMSFASDGPRASTAFEHLYALADHRADLRDVRETSVSCVIPDYLLDRPSHDDGDPEENLETQRANFAKVADAIRNGNHLGWLTWAAQVYFGLFADVDDTARPHERMITVLGETNAATAVEGFIAALSRADVPSLGDVLALSAERKRRGWWIVLMAGLIERWQVSPSLSGMSDDFLKAMLILDLANPMFEHVDGMSRAIVPGWKSAVMQARPRLASDAYMAIARAQLANGGQTVDGLHELMADETLKPFLASTVVELLRDFPNADPSRLDTLLDGIFATPAAHSGFLALAERALDGSIPLDEGQRDKWLTAAYMLSAGRYEAELQAAATSRPAIVFDLRDRTVYAVHDDQQLARLEFLAKLTGGLYPDTAFPSSGWHGDTNQWDAAEYCRKLINAISALPSETATNALRRLEADNTLKSYNPHLRHAIANQMKRRRESEYDRPDWLSTINALSNGAPATVADLHALLLEQLDDLRMRIARQNTDIYKFFWNVDSYSRPTTPRPEEACRDALVTLLRPILAPLGITVEPEGHMVADKRADISVAMPGRKILCECKRDYHADLWTAADQQLERFYAHDPEARGFGVYCVLYFGSKRPSSIPKHPDGLEPPESAAKLEHMLRDRIPLDRRARLAALVIDVSGPPT